MAKPIAYVIGGSLNPEAEARIEAGQLPRFEYHEFLARNNTDLLTFGHLTYARSAFAKLWRWADVPRLSLASLTIERAKGYSAVLCSGEDVGLPLALGSIFTRARVPIYIITHGSYLNSPKFAAAASVVRRMANVHFLPLSATLATDLVERFRIPENRVTNCGYGIDTAYFTPRDRDGAPKTIVSAGTANRDYKTLIAAVESMGVPVKIAADSAWFPTAIDIKGASLPANVEAKSYGDYASLRELYASASVVVVPLYPAQHACGYAVIAEAMAMGKPVITTKIAAHSDFVVDGETGYYVGVGSHDELRTRIKTLLEHDTLNRKMGSAAYTRMNDQFTLDAYCTRLEAAMSSSRSPSGSRTRHLP